MGLHSSLERILFGVALLLLLLPVWIGPMYLMQDGPRHSDIAHLIEAFLAGPSPLISQTYESMFLPLPNWTTYLLLIPLQALLGDAIAMKVVVSIYVLGLPLSARVALRWTNAASPEAGWLLLPFVHSLLLSIGLLNFLLALPLMVLTMGVTIRLRQHSRGFGWWILLALTTALYFTHPLVLCVTLLCCGILIGVPALLKRDALLPKRLFLYTLPSTGLLAWFLVLRHTTDPAGWNHLYSTGTRLSWLISNNLILQSSVWEVYIGALVTLAFTALLFFSLGNQVLDRTLTPNRMTLPLLAVVLFYFLTPDQIGGGTLIGLRSQIFVIIAFIFWLAYIPSPNVAKWLTCLAGLVITAGITGLRVQEQRRMNQHVAELMKAANHIPKQNRMLAIHYATTGMWPNGEPVQGRARLLASAQALLHPLTQGIELNNSQAHTDDFPIRYLKHLDPFVHLAEPKAFEEEPPRFDISRFESQTGVFIDVVLILGRNTHTAGSADKEAPSDNYTLRWSNSSGFPVEVWVRNTVAKPISAD